jgi:hypothetical protein
LCLKGGCRAWADANLLGDLPHALSAARLVQSGADACFKFGGQPRGRPSVLPSSLALRRPARTRSWIIARSNSAKTPIIWKSALPAGVVVSMPCVLRNRSIFKACKLVRNSTRSCKLRPRRSTDQAITTSNCRALASRCRASNCGRFSRPLAPLMP